MASKSTRERPVTKGREQEQEFPLPAGYEQRSPGFARAFEHAKRHGNGDKAALLYADARAHEYEYVEEES